MIRYVNMDYVFCSAMTHRQGTAKLPSYDIMCQWFKNLFTRIRALPEHLHVDLPDKNSLRYAIPKLHWYGHKEEGHSRFSLNNIPGAARNDLEAIERTWPKAEATGGSTKQSGPGGHHLTLNDVWGHQNWRKLVDIGAYS